ncbi:hypothetical protein GSI_04082 [Ganoderma sinense ZZ0214-1]|uniref:Transporter n=1 Tax=Ganoderma sinense ZZ0214-1 TaxID=1077348 RepID=A0A2G8SI62_9APHY|nr:hypothetical protein GSI_04082 [Ganoderma sinense ZZ0214-1]
MQTPFNVLAFLLLATSALVGAIDPRQARVLAVNRNAACSGPSGCAPSNDAAHNL